MKKISQFKGVIFDIDGVLLDTEYFQWQGWVEVLKSLKISLSKKDYFSYAGKRGDIIENELKEKYQLDFKNSELRNKKEKLLMKWLKSRKLKLMPYAKEAVIFFAKNKHIKIAVASGSPKDEVILKLKKANLYKLFSIIVTGSEVEKGKPYPDIYLLTIKKLKLKSQECLAFEDTQYGVESAKSAGLTCFVIPNEYSIKQNFSKADKIFRNLKEVIFYFTQNKF